MSEPSQNKLAQSKNPYLLQHAHNPVHWVPWSDEAFTRARAENKPIFLSIGYATCHWCHVMAHESFEDKAVAQLMNRAFINIKVDREERPDIDNTYMQVCQMLTGRGGWPLTIVMTPEKKPFYAATYIPKTGRQRHPGMMELIPRLNHLWRDEREKIEGSAQEITQAFQQSIIPQNQQSLPENIADTAYQKLNQQFDKLHGGFSSAPKFPMPHTLIFLLRYASSFNKEKARSMVDKTLIHMRKGGLFDHIGGGFHRYSTDSRWLLPHFEKMLYDQAMHLMAYTEGWQMLGNPLFKQTVNEIARYLLRDLQHQEGAFYSAEDADSEGKEGAFYVWSVDEVRELLPIFEAELAIEVYNLHPEGNFTDESTGQKTGKNILHRTQSIAALAAERDIDEDKLMQKLYEIKQQLFNVRKKRPRPFQDDKILTDWNGLTIAALAKAGRALDELAYIHEAKQAANFILTNLRQEDGQLLHRYRKGEAAILATADDYAFFIWGLIELYESTFKINYLKAAINLQKTFLQFYWDEDTGGFFFSGEKNEKLLGRKKEYFDSALPSGNSIAMMNLLRLGRITANTEWEEKAEMIAASTAEAVEKAPTSFTQLLQANLWATQPSHEVIIAGKAKSEETQTLLSKIYHSYLPTMVVILNDPDEPEMSKIAPYTKHQPMQNGKATAYICQNYACNEPTNNVERMINLLENVEKS